MLKVDMPNSVTHLIWTLIFDRIRIRYHVFERDGTVCTNYDNRSKFENGICYMSGCVSPFDEHADLHFGHG
jgi:hypothetical protein